MITWYRDTTTKGPNVEIPSDNDAIWICVLSSTEEALYFEAAKRFPASMILGA